MKGIKPFKAEVAPVVAPEYTRRQSIIDDYRSLWVQIHNEDLPAHIEKQLQEADFDVLCRVYEREKVQGMQEGLY